jgi:hypothetical protein
MKTILLAIAVLLTSNFAAASQLKCGFNHFAFEKSGGFKASAGAGKFALAECNEGKVLVKIAGLGPHFLAPFQERFTIKCTNKNPVGDYYGINAEVAGGLGVDVGAFVSSKGVCTLGGWQSGLGAGVIGALLRIEPNPQPQH